MHRTLARIVFVLIVSILAAGLGVATAVLYSPPGRSTRSKSPVASPPRSISRTVVENPSPVALRL